MLKPAQIKKLSRLIDNDETVALVLTAIERSPVTLDGYTVDSLSELSGLRILQVRKAVKALADIEVGKYVVGRRGGSTRFTCSSELRHYAPLPHLEPRQSGAAAKAAKGLGMSLPDDQSDSWETKVIERRVSLGKQRRYATIYLPQDFSKKDLIALHKYFETQIQ